MDLPNNEIGISDLLAHRECPRRMSFGMLRHRPQGEHPEAKSASNAYGSVIHDVLSDAQKMPDEEAIQRAFNKWGKWLDPSDLKRVKKDLETYHQRDPGAGCHCIANEGEYRVPLMEYGGKTIYFRARLDRLYQRIDNPAYFIHVDYKSSKWPKTEKEVDDDLQLWAYNWIIHEMFPECEQLQQVYDQLSYGSLSTRKNEKQREEIREWLQLAAISVIEDDTTQLDGLLEPKFNEWCPWCAVKMDCPVVTEGLTRYAEATIRGLAPVEPVLKQDGTPGKRTVMKLDLDLIQDYVEQLPKVNRAQKTLKEFEDNVRKALKEMPEIERHALGFEITHRSATEWTPTTLMNVHELLGDEFYSLVGITKSRIESLFPVDDPIRERLLRMGDKIDGAAVVKESKS